MINDVRLGSKYRAFQHRWMVTEGEMKCQTAIKSKKKRSMGLAHQVPEMTENSKSRVLAEWPGHLTELGSMQEGVTLCQSLIK